MLNRNHSIATYNPLRDMDEFEKAFFGSVPFFSRNALQEFKTDITDQGDSFLLEADLPGFAKEDIHLDVDGDVLTIQAERRSEHEEQDKDGKCIRKERSWGSYSREFDLTGVNADSIAAKYENGVLKLTLPKKEKLTPNARRLEIE